MNQILNQPIVAEVIKPKTWGPPCWTFLHCIALAYPLKPSPEEQNAMQNYFHSLAKVLPCYTCKVEFTQMLDDDPIAQHLHTREALCRWLHDKHNTINQKTGAPVMTFEDAILKWSNAPTTKRVVAAQVVDTGGECKGCFTGWGVLILVLIAVSSLVALFATLKK